MNFQKYLLSHGYDMIMTNQKDIEVLESTNHAGVIVLLIHKEKKSYSTELINQLQEAMKAQFELKGFLVQDILTILIEDESSYYKNRDLEAVCDPFWILQLDKALLSYSVPAPSKYYGLENVVEDFLLGLPKKNRLSIEQAREIKDIDVVNISKSENIQEPTMQPMKSFVRRPEFEERRDRPKEKKVLEVPSRFFRYQRRLPTMTYFFIVVNVCIYMYLEWIGDTQNVTFMLSHGAANSQVMRMSGNYLPLLSSLFIHFGWRHLFNNMFSLFLLGSTLEKAVGHFRLFLIYMGGGLAGALLSFQFAVSTHQNYVSGGASGCVFGIIGAILYIVLRHKGRFEDITLPRMFMMIGISFYSGIANAGVDNMAHLGGFLGGFVIAILVYRKHFTLKRRRR